MKPACERCKYFAETVANPAQGSNGECRRYPMQKPIRRTYWCGEFKPRRKP